MGFKEEWSWLNTYQMDAVTDESPACIVNANVGSGKTTVLIAKILYLHYEKQVPLEDMVVLTFTNKAAGEIIERLKAKQPDLTEEQVQFFGTFHSVALRMLKDGLEGEAANRPEEMTHRSIMQAAMNQVLEAAIAEEMTHRSIMQEQEEQKKEEQKEEEQKTEVQERTKEEWNQNFEIIDPDEEVELALDIIKEHKLKVKYKNRLKKRLEQEYPNYKKGKQTSRYKDDLFLLFPLLKKEKQRRNKMSFSDLIEEGINLLKMGKTSRPKWIIVDEVQDSDASQMEFLEALKGPETRIFAVGDPNQVIYSFRGTTQNMFFLLKNRFQAKELSLPINYRSNASILEAANRFLQFGGKIQGSNQTGEKIRVRNHYDPFQEAIYLADQIQKLHEGGKQYGDIVIFYRLQKQAEVLERVFEEYKVPYEVTVKKTGKDIEIFDLQKDMETVIPENTPEDMQDKVRLMTLHASKGLEFDTVFIIGVNPGLLPMRSSSFDQEEEERRLFFVGITRAKNHLELSYYTNPGEPGVLGTYSNYLRMIPKELLEWDEIRSDEEKRTNLKELARQAKVEIQKAESRNSESVSAEIADDKKQAVHKKYGTGIVISEDDMMIEVEFPNYGKKEFIKAFGEVEVI